MSERDLHAQASSWFVKLRRLPAEERQGKLQDEVTDARVRTEVLSLLAHDVSRAEEASARDEAVMPGPRFTPPERIGPYRVIRPIGRGGSGYVFLAEQSEPIERRVALKVVPQAAVSPELSARFEVERRALERTDHPHIARVLDAGNTPEGLPYLVMDYVDGLPIPEFCDTRSLSLRERLRLWLDVADAVQHAHQCGIIHRDLKPENVLVSDRAGKAKATVLDFGIAKPVAGVWPTESPPTSGLPLGTPYYMAPEQTGMGVVNTLADVYALGALLFELACGRPPIHGTTTTDPLDLLRRVREEVPPPASSVRSQQADGDSVPRSFLTDLDWILARSLEKEPERRYQTVAAFAADVRRLLALEPIEARAPSFRYRTLRFAQRHRALCVSFSIAAVALVVGVLGLTLGTLEAQRQRQEALDQGDAQRAINRFLTEDLLGAASPDRQGQSVTALSLLERASARLDGRFADRPLIAATLHQTLGQAFSELESHERAAHHLARALELRREVQGPDAPDVVRSEITMGSLRVRQQKYDEAEAMLADAVERSRRILGEDDPDLSAALNDQGVALESLGRAAEAVPILEEALRHRRRLFGERHRDVVVTLSNLALAREGVGDSSGSLELLRQALEIAESLPDAPRYTLLGLNNNLGATYQDLDRDEEALPFLRRAAELAGDTLGPDHLATLTIQANLAGLVAELGDPERGAELYERVVDQRTAQLGPDASGTLTARYGYWICLWQAREFSEAADGLEVLLEDVSDALGEPHWLTAQTRASLARALLDAGWPEEALPHAERAEARLSALYGPSHLRTVAVRDVIAEIRALDR